VKKERWRGAVGVVVFTLALWSTLVEPGAVAIREVALGSGSWPPPLLGLRFAVLGDIHAGAPHIDEDKLRAIVGRVNAAAPDVVVLLGDYVIHGVVGGRFMAPEKAAVILGGLKAPGGVFAVLGNHDWWFEAPGSGEPWRRMASSSSRTTRASWSGMRAVSGWPGWRICGLGRPISRAPCAEYPTATP
jgi:predicted MPP superfamily phosphohydrolase